jgi:hypothetical protein
VFCNASLSASGKRPTGASGASVPIKIIKPKPKVYGIT